MSGSTTTNRHLIALKLVSHVLLFYIWAPAPLLHSIRLKLEKVQAVLSSSSLELEESWQSVVIFLNQKIGDACAEDTTSRWMRHVFVEPDIFVSFCIAVIGEPVCFVPLTNVVLCCLASCLMVSSLR